MPSPRQLSAHFTLPEFNCHDGTPVPRVAIPALERLCRDVLEPLRAEFGSCTVLSGYRHRAYNASIGGAPQSQHIYDLTPDSVAVDIRFVRGDPVAWRKAARRAMVKAYGRRGWLRKAGGIGLYVRSGFVHVDSRPYRAEWQGN